MALRKFKGSPVEIVGELPAVGTKAPEFSLTKNDLSEIRLSELAGKRVVLNIFHSLDTSTCAASVRRFNEEAGKLKDTVVLCASMDLPFAQARFCGAEGLENVVTVSDFRTRSFGDQYGLRVKTGPLAGLLARTVIVIDKEGNVAYTQPVPEVSEEPDYTDVLAALK